MIEIDFIELLTNILDLNRKNLNTNHFNSYR